MRRGSNRVGRGWTAKRWEDPQRSRRHQSVFGSSPIETQETSKKRTGDAMIVDAGSSRSQALGGGRQSIEVVHSKVCLNVEGGDD